MSFHTKLENHTILSNNLTKAGTPTWLKAWTHHSQEAVAQALPMEVKQQQALDMHYVKRNVCVSFDKIYF